MYVRPVYVQTSGDNNPPLLRKVIVEYNGAVEVADTLPQALQQFPAFSDLPVTNPTTPAPTPRTRARNHTHADTDPTTGRRIRGPTPPGRGDAFAAANAALAKNPPDYTTYGQQLQLAQQKVAAGPGVADRDGTTDDRASRQHRRRQPRVPSGGSA